MEGAERGVPARDREMFGAPPRQWDPTDPDYRPRSRSESMLRIRGGAPSRSRSKSRGDLLAAGEYRFKRGEAPDVIDHTLQEDDPIEISRRAFVKGGGVRTRRLEGKKGASAAVVLRRQSSVDSIPRRRWGREKPGPDAGKRVQKKKPQMQLSGLQKEMYEAQNEEWGEDDDSPLAYKVKRKVSEGQRKPTL